MRSPSPARGVSDSVFGLLNKLSILAGNLTGNAGTAHREKTTKNPPQF
jgi:hypothetical protein